MRSYASIPCECGSLPSQGHADSCTGSRPDLEDIPRREVDKGQDHSCGTCASYERCPVRRWNSREELSADKIASGNICTGHAVHVVSELHGQDYWDWLHKIHYERLEIWWSTFDRKHQKKKASWLRRLFSCVCTRGEA
jgi:hypothetical protein